MRRLSDEDVARNVLDALWRVYRLRMFGLSSIAVSLKHGVVTLSGNVPNDSFRELVVENARKAEGVVGLEERLVDDDQLESAVALAFVPHRVLQPSRVRVTADLGKVTLEGRLDGEEPVRLAVSLAEKVPGVVAIDNRLRVVPTEEAA